MKNASIKNISPWVAVFAVALGYFVDLYDLFIFSATRVQSALEIGIPLDLSGKFATEVMNWTVGGMFIGGFLWGIIADKKGRLYVLFLSIITYTVATALNAFVYDIFYYKALRFVAGIGIAGELGLGITLVVEQIEAKYRTYATMAIVSFGMLGAVCAGLVAIYTKSIIIFGLTGWRFAFIIGAILGLLILIFRLNLRESELFTKSKDSENKQSIFNLLTNKKRALRFLYCVLCGLPNFFIVGILLILSKEFANNKGILGIDPAYALIFGYIGIFSFDIIGNLLSKKLKSRKKILYSYIVFQLIATIIYLYVPVFSQSDFYLRCGLLGASVGLGWAVMITNSAEQFGTNFRATVATSMPNLVRALLVPLTYLFFNPLISLGFTKINSAGIVILVCAIIAIFAISQLKDRFENNADFLEEN